MIDELNALNDWLLLTGLPELVRRAERIGQTHMHLYTIGEGEEGLEMGQSAQHDINQMLRHLYVVQAVQNRKSDLEADLDALFQA